MHSEVHLREIGGAVMSRVYMGLTLNVVVICLIIPVARASASLAEDVERVRNTVSVERVCELGTQIDLVIPMGQAARLDTGHLPIGLKEVLFWPTQKGLGRCCVWADGHFSYGVKTLRSAKCPWVPNPPKIGFLLQWNVDEEKVVLKVLAQTDSEKITRMIEDAQREREKTGEEREVNIISADERVLGFVRLWSEVKYNFVFFDQVPEVDWDKILEEYLPRVQKEQTTKEYYLLLQECIALLKDGHTRVWPPSELSCFPAMPALLIRSVEGKAIIADVGQTEELLAAGLKRGDEITHVNGYPVADVLQKDIYPYISASTEQARYREAYFTLLEGPVGSKVDIRIRSLDGSTAEVTLRRGLEITDQPWVVYRRPIEYRELPDGVTYVALNSFGGQQVVNEFDLIFKKIRRADGLILDVRNNGGGSSRIGYQVIGRLTDKALQSSRWKTRQYMPAFRAWGEEERWHEGTHGQVKPRAENPFLGPIVVLIGPGTLSAAEDFLIPLHASGRATLVGEKTAGSTGQPLIVDLPKGGGARICTKRDSYPDGREFVGIGVIPDVEVHPTQEDIAAGRDAVLEKGLEVLKAQLQK